jgi:hypothetical protein
MRGARVALNVAVEDQAVCSQQQRTGDTYQLQRMHGKLGAIGVVGLAKKRRQQEFAGAVHLRARFEVSGVGLEENGDVGHV